MAEDPQGREKILQALKEAIAAADLPAEKKAEALQTIRIAEHLGPSRPPQASSQTRSVRDEKCDHCGSGLPKNARFCASCGEPVRVNAEDLCFLGIRAEEKGLAGRSFLRSVVGQSSLANWEFIGRVMGGRLPRPVDVYITSFQLTYGRPIETLSGYDREEAQRALEQIHRWVTSEGWRQIPSGSHWYSYRYVANSDILKKVLSS